MYALRQCITNKICYIMYMYLIIIETMMMMMMMMTMMMMNDYIYNNCDNIQRFFVVCYLIYILFR